MITKINHDLRNSDRYLVNIIIHNDFCDDDDDDDNYDFFEAV